MKASKKYSEVSDIELNQELFKHTGKLEDYCYDSKPALKLLAEERSTGFWCCINLYSDYDYIWEVFFISSADDEVTEEGHKPTIKTQSSILERAIAEACLLAIEYRKEWRKKRDDLRELN